VGDRDALIEALQAYPVHYRSALIESFHRRLGLEALGTEDDAAFVTGLLDWMKDSQAPWEAVFFDWFCGSAERADASARAQLYASESFSPVREQILKRAPVRPERLAHAYFQRCDPVHMTIEAVEGLWAPIAEADDWSTFHQVTARIAEARAGYDLGEGRIGFLPERGA
jgi:uncharacterized protein YdiU (UPF0061 family)